MMGTRLSGREKRALTVIGLARKVHYGNVVRDMSIGEALAIYDKIVDVVREELEEEQPCA